MQFTQNFCAHFYNMQSAVYIPRPGVAASQSLEYVSLWPASCCIQHRCTPVFRGFSIDRRWRLLTQELVRAHRL